MEDPRTPTPCDHPGSPPGEGLTNALALRPCVVKESSDSGVKLEQAAQSVATVNRLALGWYVHRREEEKIAFALVVSFKMMMIDVPSQFTA